VQHLCILAVQEFLVPRLGLLPEVQQAVARSREGHTQFARLPLAACQARRHVFQLACARIQSEILRSEVQSPVAEFPCQFQKSV
jgi:hypothetical protein